jgi:hypothetical protein
MTPLRQKRNFAKPHGWQEFGNEDTRPSLLIMQLDAKLPQGTFELCYLCTGTGIEGAIGGMVYVHIFPFACCCLNTASKLCV